MSIDSENQRKGNVLNSSDNGASGEVLRHMVLGDCAAVAAIQADLDVSSWNTSQWQEAYKHYPDAWVVSRDNEIIGYAIFQIVTNQAELLNIGICRSEQGKCLGVDLLRACLSFLSEDITQVFLEVRRSNVPAINLYQKLGFSEVAIRKDYYPAAGGIREDALLLRLARNQT